MSRIGKLPVKLAAGVEIKVADGRVHVKGPKGTLVEALAPHCTIEVAGGEARVLRDSDAKRAKAMRPDAFATSMVRAEGFSRALDKTAAAIAQVPERS
jgi:large subunit ribosomal protein L6